MSIQTQLAPVGEDAPARVQTGLIERRLARFRAEVQPRVRILAAHHPWIADLAGSFPALLFALAVPRKGADADAALRLVMSGAPLAAIATRTHVPLWLRAFPPEAFATPIPELPGSPEFRRRIANHPPKRWAVAPRWLEHVALGADVGDEEIALWFAREELPKPKRRYTRKPPPDHRRLVGLWAWFSKRPQDRAHTSIQTQWKFEMQWNAALNAAYAWRNALELPLFLGDRPIANVWVEDAIVDDYAFVALRTADDIKDEAAEMKHCVDGYGSRIADNCNQLWGVRKDGHRVATLSLASGYGALPIISEISGRENKPAPDDIWLAARRWLHMQDRAPIDRERLAYKTLTVDARVWRALWRPYWLAKRRIPAWLPLTPSENALYVL